MATTAPVQETSAPRAPSPRAKQHITDTPIKWNNWHKHVNWLNVYFIGILPLIGCIAAFWTPLRWQTAVWAVVYYYCTGLGKFAVAPICKKRQLIDQKVSLPVITDFGHTRVTMPPDHWKCSSLFVEVVL